VVHIFNRRSQNVHCNEQAHIISSKFPWLWKKSTRFQ